VATSFTRHSLAEGVNLYVQPTQKFKTTVIYVYFHLPLSAEAVTRNTLLPMVLSRGSAQYPTTAALARHLDELYGAGFGYDIGRRGEVHSIVFRLEVANAQHIPGESGLLQRALTTLSGIIMDPLVEGEGFKADYVQQESTNLKQMIESLINDKRRWAMVKCTEAMCKDEPFALYRLGRVEDLATITPQDLRQHHQAMLQAAPIDIFILGDVEPEAVRTMVTKAFPFPPAGPDGRVMPKTLVKREPGRPIQDVVDRLEVNQGVLVIGLRTGITLTDPDYFPMLVANGVLGGFPHSKLFQEVREKHSLAYFAYASVETVKGIGFIYAGIEFADMAKCREIMLQQLKAMQDGQIGDEEFETTVRTLVGDMLSAADSPGAMADLAVDRVFSGQELTIEERAEAYQRVTKEQAAAAARKFQVDTVYFLNKSEGGEEQ
jgi:predicted Zn-dependent peptidase